jgi:ubiquinone/menaquinone biosynthesis C-methylase UbiE
VTRPKKQDNLEGFRQEYSRPQSDSERQVERTVLGHEVGLNGYTTVEQAQALSDSLHLTPRSRVLDVGAGRGWPGLHLARSSRCNLLSTDVPLSAMLEARAVFEEQGLRENTEVVVADGRGLPFSPESFDAVVHADVLC